MTTNSTSKRKTFSTGNKWSVGCKKYAIPAEVAEIAIKYGRNVSKGIQEMDAVIQKQKKEIDEYSKFVVMRV